jgi:hypothetical protein
LVIGIGLCVYLIKHTSIFFAIGIVYTIFVAADLITVFVGNFIAPHMFLRIYPKSVKELKHSSKEYQYIVDIAGKEIYSTIYSKPLSEVEVECYKYMGRIFIAVKRKARA